MNLSEIAHAFVSYFLVASRAAASVVEKRILMMFQWLRHLIGISNVPIFAVAIFASCHQNLVADDYFLTIGGGYNPSGNQASLEENVVFFQQVLNDKHRGSRHH